MFRQFVIYIVILCHTKMIKNVVNLLVILFYILFVEMLLFLIFTILIVENCYYSGCCSLEH